MNKSDLKIEPSRTWIPLGAAIAAFLILFGAVYKTTWALSQQSSSIDLMLERTEDIEPLKRDMAVVKSWIDDQKAISAKDEKNSLGTSAGGVEPTPVPLAPPPTPAPPTS